jgi:hypothetical protein
MHSPIRATFYTSYAASEGELGVGDGIVVVHPARVLLLTVNALIKGTFVIQVSLSLYAQLADTVQCTAQRSKGDGLLCESVGLWLAGEDILISHRQLLLEL